MPPKSLKVYNLRKEKEIIKPSKLDHSGGKQLPYYEKLNMCFHKFGLSFTKEDLKKYCRYRRWKPSVECNVEQIWEIYEEVSNNTKFIIKPSPLGGNGIFALTTFKRDDVIPIKGVLRTHPKFNALAYSLIGISSMDKDFLSMRGDVAILDHAAYFINHDCNNNSNAQDEYVEEFAEYRVVIRASKTILPGQEITLNYGINYFKSLGINCNCSKKNCSVKMTFKELQSNKIGKTHI
jgi:hypothetical protein